MNDEFPLDTQQRRERLEYANFGTRLVAVILDAVFVTIGIIVIFSVFGIAANADLANNDEVSAAFLFGALLFYFIGIPLGGLLYRSLFEASRHQGTPGKIIMGIKVVDPKGNRISVARALGRNLAKLLSSFLLIGYLISLADKKGRTLHDLMADTRVLMKESSQDF